MNPKIRRNQDSMKTNENYKHMKTFKNQDNLKNFYYDNFNSAKQNENDLKRYKTNVSNKINAFLYYYREDI